MVRINSNFIGEFTLGDNINHNLDFLALLYQRFEGANEEEKRLLCKPIIIALVSIIEAVLHDLHTRIRTFTREGVTNLTGTVIDYVRGKKIDEFEKYIASARKHDFFSQADAGFYNQLDELRRLRNRIHIQNAANHFEPRERDAFTEARKVQAERALEKTMKIMAERYPRAHHHVDDFDLPWDGYFVAEDD